MKTLIVSILLAGLVYTAFGQGEVIFGNNNNIVTKIVTNGPAGSGLTATNANGFYYGLFIAPVGETNFGNFTFTGNYATNLPLLGRFYGYDPKGTTPLTGGASVVPGWLPGTTMSYLICGWSANLGHDWSSIASQLANGDWVDTGFFGESTIGQASAGGLAGGPLPAPPLMGPGQGVVLQLDSFSIAMVTPLAIPAPEPGTLVLAGLGGLSLLAFRRKK